MARREEQAYRAYVTDEQRSQPGCVTDSQPADDTVYRVAHAGTTVCAIGTASTQLVMTRRNWLSMIVAAACRSLAPMPSLAAHNDNQSELESRAGRVIREYELQGFHRTATAVDRRSGDWLCDEVRRMGVTPVRESFGVNRVDPENGRLIVGDRRIEGLPLFDGAFTDARGLRGRLGPIDSDAEIGLVEAAPNTAAAGPLGQARRQSRHRALVCVTRGGLPGRGDSAGLVSVRIMRRRGGAARSDRRAARRGV